MKSSVKKLFLMQMHQNGITQIEYNKLKENEQQLLEKQGEKYNLKNEARKLIIVVLTGGVFDVLHIGHIYTLNEARTQGDVLIVAIASDEYIRRKGREPVHSQEERRVIIESLRSVDMAISGFSDPKQMVEFVKPDIIFYGYDQKEFLKPEGIRIVRAIKKMDESKYKSGKILQKLGI